MQVPKPRPLGGVDLRFCLGDWLGVCLGGVCFFVCLGVFLLWCSRFSEFPSLATCCSLALEGQSKETTAYEAMEINLLQDQRIFQPKCINQKYCSH